MSQYRIDPKNYSVKEVTLSNAEIRNYGNLEYIGLDTKESCMHQSYPGVKLMDLNEGIQYLLECFDVKNLADLEGKKAWSVCSNMDIFCLVNPDNNKLFSLAAKFYPERYSDVLDEIKSQPGNQFLNKLEPHDALLVGVLKSIPVTGRLEEQVVNLVNTYSMYNILSAEIPTKSPNTTKKKKI